MKGEALSAARLAVLFIAVLKVLGELDWPLEAEARLAEKVPLCTLNFPGPLHAPAAPPQAEHSWL